MLANVGRGRARLATEREGVPEEECSPSNQVYVLVAGIF
jgi:hypothetical protein